MKNVTSILLKSLVWLGMLIIYSVIFLTLGNGLILVATFLLLIYCGSKLCQYIDWRQIEKKTTELGLTPYEYACQGLSEEFIANMEEAYKKDAGKHNSSRINQDFKVLIRKGKLTKEQAIVFKKEFSNRQK